MKDYIKVIDLSLAPSIEANKQLIKRYDERHPNKKVCPNCGSKCYFIHYENVNGPRLLKCDMCDKIYDYDEKDNFPTRKEYQRKEKLERIMK